MSSKAFKGKFVVNDDGMEIASEGTLKEENKEARIKKREGFA